MIGPGHISQMAVSELETALEAHASGDTSAAVCALMRIDTESWQAIERRLTSLGGDFNTLLDAIASQRQP